MQKNKNPRTIPAIGGIELELQVRVGRRREAGGTPIHVHFCEQTSILLPLFLQNLTPNQIAPNRMARNPVLYIRKFTTHETTRK